MQHVSGLIPRPDGGEWSRDIVSQRLPWDTCNKRGESKWSKEGAFGIWMNFDQTLPVFSLGMLLKDCLIPLRPLWIVEEEWLPTLRTRKRRRGET